MTAPRTPDETLELFTFAVGPHHYAVDVLRVDEILPATEVTPAQNARAPVEGTVSLRGEPVPVVDLRRCLPPGTPPGKSDPRLLVLWLGKRRVAFRVDGVGGVVRVATASLLPAPAGQALPAAVIAATAPPAGDHLLLDLRALLRQQSPAAPGPE